jgi:hypothetical protein
MRLRCAPSRGLRARRRCESRWAGAGAGARACRRSPGRAQIARCWRWPPVCMPARTRTRGVRSLARAAPTRASLAQDDAGRCRPRPAGRAVATARFST